jgi:hypothetical protein
MRHPSPLLAVAAGEPTRMTQPDSDKNEDKPDWERRIEKAERRQLLTVIIFLAVVFVILAIWWSWGKIIHRRRRL